MSRDEIQHRLSKELNDAQCAYIAANSHFQTLAKEVPSGIPSPDGSLRIWEAGVESRRKLEMYGRAMKRYNEFTLYGTIPEDLRDVYGST